jgi:hypothetical protein
MTKKQGFFEKIDFNKSWDEDDWEKFFQAHDSYRNSHHAAPQTAKPLSRIKFEGSDEVIAFEPVMRAYSTFNIPSIVNQLNNQAFYGDGNPERDYHPSTDQDPHYWGEGAPLATVLIYRDCCRFAICTALEIEKFLKRKDMDYRKKYNAEFEALRFHANWLAINVGEGHKIGYSDERIRGNIAKCRRALKHADICVGLISRISLRTKSLRLRKELFSFAFQLRNALFDWIDELRLRVN